MEPMFSPCTRLRDRIDESPTISDEMKEDLHFIEEFRLHVSTEEFRNAVREKAFTYADLYAMLEGDSLVWFTPALSAAVFRKFAIAQIYSVFMGDGFNDTDYSFICNVDGQQISSTASSSDELLEMCDILLRLAAAKSDVHSVKISNWRCANHVSINATSLAYLIEQCQNLKALTLSNVKDLDRDHITVIGAFSGKIELICCQFTIAGTSALAEVLERNQGTIKLEICDIDYSVLAGRLGSRGNTSLKRLAPCSSSGIADQNQQLQGIAGYLRQYRGLIELNVSWYDAGINDETWDAICDSLKAHPTLAVLELSSASTEKYYTRPPGVPAVITSRVQALVDMLKVNSIIHTISLRKCYSDHDLFRRSVIPYLKTNRLRPRLLAIQKTCPIPYRAKVLGRALLSARTDANSFWMLLSGNPEVAFMSRTTAMTAATNLPTPVTTAAENPSTVTVTATTTGSLSIAKAGAPVSAALSDSTVLPSTCQKRKAPLPRPLSLPLQGLLLLLVLLLYSWLLPLPLVTNKD
jgi:hypothetical protein